MIDCGLTIKLLNPQLQDRQGRLCASQSDSFGCRVTANITRPDIIFVADEVGGNIFQREDGPKGGEKLLCQKGCAPYHKVSKKDRHFTVMGITSLTCNLLCCIVIVKGEQRNLFVESGIDVTATPVSDVSDDQFFEQNFGENKYFPRGPTCIYNGFTVPSFVRFQEAGSMISGILTDVLGHIDSLHLFDKDRSLGCTSMFTLDRHESRFGTEFLAYINNKEHK